MKTNITLMVVSSCAVLALAGCGKNSETETPAPPANSVPAAPKPEAATPPAGGDANVSPSPSVVPEITNNPAVTNH